MSFLLSLLLVMAPAPTHESSVCRILSPTVHGSGFFVEDNYLITAAHVVRNHRSVIVVHRGTYYGAKVIAANKRQDIALVYCPIKGDVPLTLLDRNIAEKSRLRMIGYPDPHKTLSTTFGRVDRVIHANRHDNLKGRLHDTWALIVKIRGRRGYSGGPIMSGDKVCGMFTHFYEQYSTSYGPTSVSIKKFVDKYRRKPK